MAVLTALTRDRAHGPLPALLLLLTTATGVVDAVSIIGLGRVFVANMTGNVVFVGFALAGVPGFSLAASLAALLGFLVGSFLAGTVLGRLSVRRGRLLGAAVAAEAVLVAAALVLVGLSTAAAALVAAAALLACAMGAQNTAVRALAVPDLTTTVLTMTLTGIAADLRGGDRAQAARRVLAVLAMFLGAVAGALLVLHVGSGWALATVLALLVAVSATAFALSGPPEPWNRAHR